MTNQPALLDIPELLLEIFSHLPTQRDQIRFLLLCKATWSVAVGEMWKEVRDAWHVTALLPSKVTIVGPVPQKIKVCLCPICPLSGLQGRREADWAGSEKEWSYRAGTRQGAGARLGMTEMDWQELD